MPTTYYYAAYRDGEKIIVVALDSRYHAESWAREGFATFRRTCRFGLWADHFQSVREEFERQES